MFCPNCGKEIPDNSVYCNICGAKIKKDELNNVTPNDGNKVIKTIYKYKKIIIGLMIIIFVCAFGFEGYSYVQVKNFNNLVGIANKKYNTGDYNGAIQAYNKALTYKKNTKINEKIISVRNCIKLKGIYNDGLKLINDKKYTDAIEKLSQVNKSSLQIYNEAQSKIKECKNVIISNDINAANDAIKKKNYDSADEYINDILKLDSGNNEAKQLKDTVAQDREKVKAEEQAAAQAKAQQNTSPIIIKYSIDENGIITDASYPNNSSIQVKTGQMFQFIGNISPVSTQRILIDGKIMDWINVITIKTIAVGGGDINIIPNGYDWDKAYTYHIIVSN